MESNSENAKEVAKYRKEIEADFSPLFFKLFASITSPILEKTFPEISVRNLEYAREAANRGVVVYASNHKSYTDPLLLGLVLHRNNLKQPYYAAGKNMFNLWSSIPLKKIGAFSVDRANKNAVYLKTLNQYIANLVRGKKDLLVYIEGGRSYDGRIKNPKLGILKSILNSKEENVFIIPTAVNYEQVIEDRVLTTIAVKTKQRRFTDEIKELLDIYFNYYPNVTNGKRSYSTKAYLSFSKPIEAKHYSETRSDLRNAAEIIRKSIHDSQQPSSTSMVAEGIHKSMTGYGCVKLSEIKDKIQPRGGNLEQILEEGLNYLTARGTLDIKVGHAIIEQPKIIEYYANSLH